MRLSPVAGTHKRGHPATERGAACRLKTPGCFWSPPQGRTSRPNRPRACVPNPNQKSGVTSGVLASANQGLEGTSLFNHTAPVPASLAPSLDSDDMAPMFDPKDERWDVWS